MGLRQPKYFTDMSEKEIIDWLNSIDTVLIDCDGVLWYLYKTFENVVNVIDTLKALNRNVNLVTNNSTLTRDEFKSLTKRSGFNIESNEIYCTAHSTALYLKQKNVKGSVYIIGSESIKTELDKLDIPNFGVGVSIFTYIYKKK